MRYLISFIVLLGCNKPYDLKKEEAKYDAYIEALPELKPVAAGSQVELKVRYLSEPRFADLNSDERKKLYSDVSALCEKIYRLKLDISESGSEPLKDFFKRHADRFKTSPIAFPSQAFQISFFAPDRQKRIAETVAATLKKHDKPKIREYLGNVENETEGAKSFLEKLSKIYGEKDLAGKPLLVDENAGDEIYFSYGHWSSLLQGEKDADFILTNGGIMGADNGMPLYVIARGGVTNAFVENNAHRPYQGAGVVGMYPFLSDTPYFSENRGKLSRAEKLEAIAWLWVHELGHLLLKKEENYAFADSVHRAPPKLRYADWVKAVRASSNHRSAEIRPMKKF